ncbi:MAG: extensin family protein, partial [Hyphomicrobiaceae bacterium]
MAKKKTKRGRVPFFPNTLKLLAFIFLIFGIVVVLRHGYVPARYSPFTTVNLDDPSGWFLDWRIAQLADDRPTCRRILKRPNIMASPVRDRGQRGTCGWTNAFRVSQAGGAAVAGAPTLECPEAAAVALWMQHAVQPAAEKFLASRVTRINTAGSYNCRNIRGGIGNYFDILSEHARANALDVTGFRLANGQTVSVLRDWRKGGKKAKF